MGKGSRNRQIHLQDKMENPQKYKAKKQAPKWLGSVIGLVLVAAILIGVVAGFISDSGIIKRSRVVLESQTGKFDVTQQMATFLAWQEIYSSAYYYWYYCSYGLVTDTNNITTTFSSADQYAMTVAQVSVTDSLRDSVDDIMETLKIYVAVCDEADRNNVGLEAEDNTNITESLTELKTMQTNYGYTSFGAFLDDAMGEGMKEKDVKAALQLVHLYNKYTTQIQSGLEKAVTMDQLVDFRDANPEDYYKFDYLTYSSDTQEFADKLKECETAEEFKAMVLENHLANNYKTAYNKYTTTVTASEELSSVSGKTDANNKTALTDALNAIGADAAKELGSKDSFFEDKSDLKEWIFNKNRDQFDTTTISTDDGIYLIAFMSEEANTEKANVRLKFYEFVEGTAYESDLAFKDNIIQHITESKKEAPTYPTVDYKKAETKAEEIKKELTAEGADIERLLDQYDATDKKGITSSTSSTSSLPKIVIEKATASSVKEGNIIVANDTNVSYVIYVQAVNGSKFDISFVTVEADVYYQIINDLTTSLDKVYPTKQTASFDSDAEKNTFEAWISELKEGDALVTARKENETNVFEKTETKDKEDVTTYNAYMIINTPMYLDTEIVVKGGYLEFTESTYAEDANEALNTLKDKTDVELLNALSALDSTASVSTELKKSDVLDADENLHNWLFSDDRNANDTAVVTAKDGKSAYVAVFSEKAELWASTAKSNYVTEKVEEWVDSLTEKYTPNEKVLDKLGEPTTTAETTGSETTSAESTAEDADLNG